MPENTSSPAETVEPRGFTCLPYVQGVSERIKHIEAKMGVRTAFKLYKTLADVFRKPVERPTANRIKVIVYKSCSFIYVEETKRMWDSRWLEHKPGVRRTSPE